MKLKIGKIPYANLFPLFYALERERDCSSYEFVEGVPSKLNRLLRSGRIDISPSSSIEYLRNPSLYKIIEGHSISSKGPVGSILLFSNRPIEELNGSAIYVSSHSETSVALLYVVLKKFYGLQCDFQETKGMTKDMSKDMKESLNSALPLLLIGDEAMKYKMVHGSRTSASSVEPFTVHSLYLYDLGDLWYRHTGLPFVFALWVVRTEAVEPEHPLAALADKFITDLNSAKSIALRKFPEIAGHSALKAFMSEGEIISYWKKIDYDLTDEHKKGMELFRQFLKELAYL